MRRRRRSKATLGVQLFPFLAVLICTFGVLIVLLVVVVKRADVNAQRVRDESEQNAAHKRSNLETQRDLLEFQSEAFADNREDFQAELEDARKKRSYLREGLRELTEKRKLLAIEYVQLQESESKPEAEENLEQQMVDVRNEIASLKDELAEKKSAVKTIERKTYSIVPYEGNGGTNRRPIFVECREDGIYFRPSGIRLTEADFAGPMSTGNPLDQAFLAVREYWNRMDLAGREGDPYPLIVVRPQGTKMYSLLRHAIKSWDDEFGYELVPAGLDVDFGRADPGLQIEIQNAIDIARKRQLAIRMARAGQAAGRRMARPSGLRASGTMGGFVDASGQPAGFGGGQDDGLNSPENSMARDSAKENAGGWNNAPKQDSSAASRYLRSMKEGQLASSSAFSQQTKSSSFSQPSNGRQMNRQQASSPGGNAGGNAAAGSSQPNPAASLAESRGENWALPTRSPGSIGYVRGIQMKCSDDALVLMQSRAAVSRIEMNGPTSEVVVGLVDEVWKIIEDWGVAGAGSYWKPELQIEVAPGGENRYAELKQLLRGSGVVVRRLVR